MAGYLPAGFVDSAWLIQRTGDPDPYIISFAFRTFTLDPWTPDLAQDAFDATSVILAPELRTFETLIGADFRVGPQNVGPIINIRTEVVGTGGSSDVLPQNTAILVRKNSGRGGRQHRGRFFWPSVLSGAVSNVGELDGVIRTAVQDTMDDLLALYAPGGNDFLSDGMVILHSGETPTPTDIISLDVAATVATQRRRLR